MKRRHIVILAAFVALVLVGSVTANAASLGTIASGIFGANGSVTYASGTRSISAVSLATTGGNVTSLTATISGSTLSNLNGQVLTVSLQNSSGTQVQAVTGTLVTGTNLTVAPAAATVTLAVPGSPAASSFSLWSAFVAGTQALGGTADATQREVALGHGSVTVVASTPAWQQAVLPASGVNSATSVSAVAQSSTTDQGDCLNITLTGTSATPQAWGVSVDYSKPPFYGTTPVTDYQTTVVSNSGSTLKLAGGSGYATLTNTQTITILVCAYSGVTPADEPQAYSVGPEVHGTTWSNTLACEDRTITGNGYYPFYFGWSTTFDMTAAINLVKTSDAGAPRRLYNAAGNNANNILTPSTYTAGTTSYGMLSYFQNAVSGTGTYVAELCVSEY
jgi:hypothetical protein